MRSIANREFVLGCTGIAALLVIWEIVSQMWFVPAVLPAPTRIVAELVDYARSGALARDIGMSLMRVAVGFACGSFVGATLGLAMGSISRLRRSLEPVVQFFRFVPSIAWLTPALIWFGLGETGKYVLITYTTMFMVLLSTLAGALAIPRNRIRTASCFGASPLQTFWYVKLPSTLPHIITGMRQGMGNSFQTLIVAEMLAAKEGLGFLILNSRNQLATELVFVGIVAMGAVGLATDAVFRSASRRLAWRFNLGW
jgi:ABC-type nitrate/sulfonate/bicarbonate transport system permease component